MDGYPVVFTAGKARGARARARDILAQEAGTGRHVNIVDWLQASIAETHLGMETCDEPMQFYRMQGEIQAMRGLLNILTPQREQDGE